MAEVCDTVQEPVTKTTPKGKMQEGKVVVLRGLQIAVEKKEVESKGERERPNPGIEPRLHALQA